MSRKVYVSSDISLDETLAEVADVEPMAALLWPWLLVHLDDWGRGSASIRRLKAQMFPLNRAVTEKVIERALGLYADRRLIALYEVGEHRYLAVNPDKWWKYQTHIHKSKRDIEGSAFPAPPEDAFAENRGESRDSAENRASSLPPFTTTYTIVHRAALNGREFDSFWSLYPRKQGKGQARKAWDGACKKASPEDIRAALEGQIPKLEALERRFIPLASTWLNGERWTDELPDDEATPHDRRERRRRIDNAVDWLKMGNEAQAHSWVKSDEEWSEALEKVRGVA